MKTEAQMCMTCLQTKTIEDRWQAARSWKRQEGPSPGFFRESPAPEYLMLDCWPSELGGTTALSGYFSQVIGSLEVEIDSCWCYFNDSKVSEMCSLNSCSLYFMTSIGLL